MDTFVNRSSFPDNQDKDNKFKYTDMKQDNPLTASLFTWSQHGLSPLGGRKHACPADSTTLVVFPFMGTDKLGQLG